MVTKYDKNQILSSMQFKGVQKDLLVALLDEDKKYSVEDCEKLIKKENGRRVK